MSTEEQWYAIITVVIAVIFLWRWWGMTSDIAKIRKMLEKKLNNDEVKD